MKLFVITSGDGPESRKALELGDRMLADGLSVEMLDWETEEAAALASIHDVYAPPAYIIVRDDGSQVAIWQGTQEPIESEIRHLM